MKYYVVNQITGDWDSAWSKPIFVTDKEYKAKFYCSKANGIISKYKDWYTEKALKALHDFANKAEGVNYSHWSDRNDFVVGSFHYSEIQFKTNIKIKQ